MSKKTENTADLAKSVAQFYGAALKRPDRLFAAYYSFWEYNYNNLMGIDQVQPAKADKRFQDPIWQSNPLYKAAMTGYLSWCRQMNEWVNGLEVSEREKLRAKFLTSLVTDTLSPTNTLLGNPAAIKTTLEKGGKNLFDGAKNLIEDMVKNNGMPAMVDKSRFKVGEDIAATEGSVVYRGDLLELIQYSPKTEKVYKRPIFIVPPQINKYYVWDLAPKRSVVEFLLEQGHQVFIVSWKNPREENSHWNMDEYVLALGCSLSGRL